MMLIGEYRVNYSVGNHNFFFPLLFSLRCIMARGTPVEIQKQRVRARKIKRRDLSLGPALDEIYCSDLNSDLTCSGSDSL